MPSKGPAECRQDVVLDFNRYDLENGFYVVWGGNRLQIQKRISAMFVESPQGVPSSKVNVQVYHDFFGPWTVETVYEYIKPESIT